MGERRDASSGWSAEQHQLLELLLRNQGIELEDVITPRQGDGDAPLSHTQERLWRTGELAPGTPYGNLPVAFRLRGQLDLEALRFAVQRLTDRHEILRTTFPVVNGRPVQRVQPAGTPLEIIELGIRNGQGDDGDSQGLAVQRVLRPFRLDREPSFRPAVILVSERESLLLLTTHHLATDGWGVRIMLRELSRHYNEQRGAAARAARPGPAPSPPVQYADYAIWMRRRLGTSALDPELAYWEQQLRDAPRSMSLPRDHTHAPVTDFAARTHPLRLSRAQSDSLRKLSREEGVTLFTTLVAILQMALHTYDESGDVVVGSIISNRNRPETEELIGNFGNNVLLRMRFADNPSLRVVLRRTNEVVLGAQAHRELPLERLAEHLQGRGRAAVLTGFQCLLLLRDAPVERYLELDRLEAGRVPTHVGLMAPDLSIDLIDGREELTGTLEYRAAVFEPATIARLERHFTAIVDALITDVDQPVGRLPRFEHAGAEVTPHPADGKSARHDGSAAPKTETERFLSELWKQVLGNDDFGVHDNFFDLGGTSLGAVTVIEQVERRTGHRLHPLEFSTQTLKQLATTCERGAKRKATPKGKGLVSAVRSLVARFDPRST